MNDIFLSGTPLHAWHLAAGARMAGFAGYDMPIAYGDAANEHRVCRSAAALFDISHLGRLRLEGVGAAPLLDRLLTRRVTDLPVGGVRYALICDIDGGVIDDATISRVETPSGTGYYLLTVNAANRGRVIEVIRPLLDDFPMVTLTDRTDLTAMIAVQGPMAIPTVARLFRARIGTLKRFRAVVTEQFGKPAIVSRTGTSGEDGIEVIVRAEESRRVWENLLMAGRQAGFTPAGLAARESLRIEAGIPGYGHELDRHIDPINAGLAFACDLNDRQFTGQQALARIAREGPRLAPVGLILSGPDAANPDATRTDFAERISSTATDTPGDRFPVIDATGRTVGWVTSHCHSPMLGVRIAMAMIERSALSFGDDLSFATPAAPPLRIDTPAGQLPATLTKLPFYRRTTGTPPSPPAPTRIA